MGNPTSKNLLKRFCKEDTGSVAVEAAIILPILIWAFIATFAFFDAYRTRSATDKAAFTISDMLSRETAPINATYMANARKLFDMLAKSDSASALRVSVITWSSDTEDYELDWSNTQGAVTALTGTTLLLMKESLPSLLPGERLILVETISTYEPALNVGIGDKTLNTFVFTRPRFAPQLVWES